MKCAQMRLARLWVKSSFFGEVSQAARPARVAALGHGRFTTEHGGRHGALIDQMLRGRGGQSL